jgi:hypothetical protein
MDERFFYHSFPRRGASTAEEIDKGCKILTAIRDFGLLLTPQLIEWNQPSFGGAPPRVFPVLQKRVCFTELGPLELPQHAEKFGHFALEFEIDTVRRLGAVPVFYVPQPTSEAAVDGSAVGTALLAIAMDSHVVIQRMAYLDQLFKGSTPVAEQFDWKPEFARSPDGRDNYRLNRDEAKNFIAAIGHAVTPWDNLRDGAFALLNFFHPTDNIKQDKALEYYREREWRIACGFRIKNSDGLHVDVLHVPTRSERQRFLEIDREFFQRKISTDTGMVETLNQALVHPGLNGKRLIEMVRRVVAPAEAVDRAAKILGVLDNPPQIISMNELQPR